MINEIILIFKKNLILFKISSFLLIILLGLLLIAIFKKFYNNIFGKLQKEKPSILLMFFQNTIKSSIIPLFYLSLFYFAFNFIELDIKFLRYLNILFIILATFFILRFAVNIISFIAETYLLNKSKDATKIKNLKGILIILKVIIWGLGVILILDNLGYKISAVLAGLGIGGIAVALAAQTILGDLFSYFIIIFDKPFEVGDFIVVSDAMGTVETIGIKTTRIRSISGEELIFSNSDLTNSRVKNFKRMHSRRVVFKIGVTYNTHLEKLKKIPEIIKSIIESINETKFDRAHFVSYGDYALIYEIVYFVNNSDYNKYMDIQQEINFKLYEEFSKLKIDFAYPTQTIFLNKS